jgi:RND family efflux transporter MFP subunit
VIEAKISGRVEQMPIAAGQSVQSGELLVQLDAREIQARLDQASALRDQADADLQRFSALLAQEAVTRAEFDAVQARQRIGQAAVTEAETQLAHTRVLAPFDGVITRKHADVGDLAAPGRPLVEIEDPSRLRLVANVPEALIGRLRLGDTLRVRVDAINQILEAPVAEIAPSADPNSRTFLAKLDLPGHPGLRAGQFGRVSIPVGELSALRVPASAVLRRGQMEIAFVADNGHARLRLVKTGKLLGEEIEILSGIDTNESVIVDGLVGLLDGQPIKIIE